MTRRRVRLQGLWCDVWSSARGVARIRLGVRPPGRGGPAARLPRRLDLSWATPFQRRILDRLARIPPGRTTTYGRLARAVGSSPRAVGRAVGANRLPLVFP
jgi:hypothetical protein